MHIIPNHSNMTALEMGLSPDILTRHDLRPMTAHVRLEAYREKLDAAISAGHGVTCEVVSKQVSQQVAKPNNISLILRKGGAK